jgi:hypothetical protein
MKGNVCLGWGCIESRGRFVLAKGYTEMRVRFV